MEKHDFSTLIKKHPKVNSPEKYQEWFDEIACQLMNHCCLISNCNKYRIVECEIYYNDTDSHPDMACLNDVKQLYHNQWFFHYSGIDYTFGNENPKIYAGILIRGIRELKDEKLNNEKSFISGPLKVLCKILNNNKDGKIDLSIVNNQKFDDVIYQGKRFGISEIRDVANGLYRYITEKEDKHHYNDKTNFIGKEVICNDKALLGI